MKPRLPAPPAALLAASPSPAPAALDVAGLARDVDACTDFYRYANAQLARRHADPRRPLALGHVRRSSRERNEELLREAFEGRGEGAAPRRGHARSARSSTTTRAAWTAPPSTRPASTPLEPHFDAHRRRSKDAASLAARARAACSAREQRRLRASPCAPTRSDSTRYLAEIVQGGLGLPDRDYYFNDDERTKQQREAYRTHLARMFGLAGRRRAPRPRRNARRSSSRSRPSSRAPR